MKKSMRVNWVRLAAALIVLAVAACSSGDDDDDGDDGTEVDWVPLPGGTYTMGCEFKGGENADLNEWCHEDEAPQHDVTLDAFAVTRTEITQAQFEARMGFNPSAHPNCPDCPADSVNWFDAQAFCEEVGGRLPTEAEWEYAARGGSTLDYYCGDDPSCVDDIAWNSKNAGGGTHPVGQKTPNDFGLYDVLGNVFEWVADWWAMDTYSVSPASNPTGPADGEKRVIRGGSWLWHYEGPLRHSCRQNARPEAEQNNIGFRCARDE